MKLFAVQNNSLFHIHKFHILHLCVIYTDPPYHTILILHIVAYCDEFWVC